LSYGRAAFDHRHAYKFNVIYEMPFLKQQKGFAGQALGGWTLSSFLQLYSGHPVDVYNGNGRFAGSALDANGIPENIGGDYNLDNVLNDHPVFLGSNLNAVYSGRSPADGIFIDNNPIGCGFPGSNTPSGLGTTPANVPSGSLADCNLNNNGLTPILDANGNITGFVANTLFGNPAYPGSGALYKRFGTLGRNVFHGPKFVQMDMALGKTFKLTEMMKLEFRATAQNLLNHPSFDCVDGNLSDGTFGAAQCLAQNPSGTTLGAPTSRIMSLGLRLAF